MAGGSRRSIRGRRLPGGTSRCMSGSRPPAGTRSVRQVLPRDDSEGELDHRDEKSEERNRKFTVRLIDRAMQLLLDRQDDQVRLCTIDSGSHRGAEQAEAIGKRQDAALKMVSDAFGENDRGVGRPGSLCA